MSKKKEEQKPEQSPKPILKLPAELQEGFDAIVSKWNAKPNLLLAIAYGATDIGKDVFERNNWTGVKRYGRLMPCPTVLASFDLLAHYLLRGELKGLSTKQLAEKHFDTKEQKQRFLTFMEN